MARAERGVVILELAIALPLVLVITMAAVDFGRAFFTRNVLDQAAREGCRLAVITDPDTALVRQRVVTVCQAAGVTPSTLTIQGPDAQAMVTVRVETAFTWIAPGLLRFIGVAVDNPQTMAGQTAMRFES